MLSAGAMLLSNAAGYSPSSSPSQLVILGMHHSGTSLLANLTMMMGAYGGEKDELLLHPDNPLKYWERRDVVALDEARLAAGLNEAVSQRYDMPSWVAYGFDAEKAAAPVHGSAEAKAIVSKLNEKRPWVTKDPRMSLVASEWMQLLDAPACVIMHREPLSVANSMMIYSHNVSLAEWISVYENYYASTMRACKGVRAPPVGTESGMERVPRGGKRVCFAVTVTGGRGGGAVRWRAQGRSVVQTFGLCEPRAPRPTPHPRLTRSLRDAGADRCGSARGVCQGALRGAAEAARRAREARRAGPADAGREPRLGPPEALHRRLALLPRLRARGTPRRRL